MRRTIKKVDGKVILRSVPSPEVEHRVVGLLSQLMKRTPPEKIRAGIARTPVVLAKRIRPEKGEKLVEALTKMGANAAFVPLRPGEQEKLANGNLKPRVVEMPVDITPPPGRILKKWLRRTALALFLALAVLYAVVENMPLIYPDGISPIPQPDRAELSGLLPVGKTLPSLLSVHPLDMMDVQELQYRLPPDRRLLQVLASLAVQFEAMMIDGAARGRFRPGALQSDGTAVTIPLIIDNRVAAEIQVAQPITFPGVMAACATWISMMAAGADVVPPPQVPANAISGTAWAIRDVPGIDPRSILKGLGTLETLSRAHGPQWVILKAAARGYGYLHMSLFPDRTDARDQLAAHGLGLLALARWLAPETDLTMEEALLADQMGYTAHALNLIRGSAFYSAGPSDRLTAAYIMRDARLLSSPQKGGSDRMQRYLLARLHRELGQSRSAEILSDALLGAYPDLFPAMVEAIYSGPRDLADAVSRRFLWAVVSAVEDAASVGGHTPESLSETEKAPIPQEAFEALVNRTALPEGSQNGRILDNSLTRQVYRILYTGAMFLRFQLLLELRDFAGAAAVEDSLMSDSPLAMTLRAQILANTGKHEETAALAAKIVTDPDSSARLALQAVQLSGAIPKRLARLKDAARRMDDRPVNRFFMASLFQNIWYGDMAETFYTSGLREDPLRFSAYYELAGVTGSMSPIEAALAAYDRVAALHIAAGDFYAEQPDPEEAEKSLAYYKQADGLAPREATPALKTRRVLYRFGRKSEAATVLKEKLDQRTLSGSAELRLRVALADTYLDMKQPDNALAVIDPIQPVGGPEIALVMARVYEIQGRRIL